ncbi:hypothetical protein TYRP_010318 [Tyrophagus putrescentiae]|nr:hypothetical protein TYRP_010318 [Tyrophagus putrescentiae]
MTERSMDSCRSAFWVMGVIIRDDHYYYRHHYHHHDWHQYIDHRFGAGHKICGGDGDHHR